MAELKKNRKALESQRKIYKGLRKILLKKNLEDVTVKDIEEECHISRSTFYRNFNNVVDVLEVMLDWFYMKYTQERKTKKNKMLFFFEYWSLHKDLLYIVTRANMSIFINIMKKYEAKDNETILNSYIIASINIPFGYMITEVYRTLWMFCNKYGVIKNVGINIMVPIIKAILRILPNLTVSNESIDCLLSRCILHLLQSLINTFLSFNDILV